MQYRRATPRTPQLADNESFQIQDTTSEQIERTPKVGTLRLHGCKRQSNAGAIAEAVHGSCVAICRAIRHFHVPNQCLPFRSGNVRPRRYIPLYLYKTAHWACSRYSTQQELEASGLIPSNFQIQHLLWLIYRYSSYFHHNV